MIRINGLQRIGGIGLALAAILAAAPAPAHEGATGIVKERMDLMSAAGSAMKALHAMAQGKAPYDAARVRAAAAEIAAGMGETPGLFPAGSGGHPSAARPEIWTDMSAFRARADAARSEA